MKRIISKWLPALAICALAVVAVALCAGAISPESAITGAALANAAVVDLSELEQAMKQAFAAMQTKHKHLSDQVLELAQKVAARPGFIGGGGGSSGSTGELAELIRKSDAFGAFTKGSTPSFTMEVPARLLSKSIVNATGSGQPLVASDRALERGIVHAPQQRLTIRALFGAVPTDSNMIERPTEATFTGGAGVQGGDASPTGSGEGALKNESNMTFTLAQTPVVTLAHYIVASRQILGDAPLLQMHLENRLLYNLNLKEETQMLTGDGTAGSMTGITSSATAFTGGATNQTRLDTLAKAANQLAVANYEPSGFVLHPADWLACQLEKDSQGRYILGDPGAQVMPMAWGLPVVPTPSMTQGKFVCVDAARYGYIADRESATVRVSENVNDQFIRNLVTLLCEKRTVLVTELGTAAVYGSLATPG